MKPVLVDVRVTKTGAFATQVFIPSRQAKLSCNRSHYQIVDELKAVDVEIGGKKRTMNVMVKAWIPIPRRERMDESDIAAMKRLNWYSPMLK